MGWQEVQSIPFWGHPAGHPERGHGERWCSPSPFGGISQVGGSSMPTWFGCSPSPFGGIPQETSTRQADEDGCSPSPFGGIPQEAYIFRDPRSRCSPSPFGGIPQVSREALPSTSGAVHPLLGASRRFRGRPFLRLQVQSIPFWGHPAGFEGGPSFDFRCSPSPFGGIPQDPDQNRHHEPGAVHPLLGASRRRLSVDGTKIQVQSIPFWGHPAGWTLVMVPETRGCSPSPFGGIPQEKPSPAAWAPKGRAL